LGTLALCAADRRLFLEDALTVTLLTALACAAIVICVRRWRAAATSVAWGIALVGVVAAAP
jgi:type IV secretory pathway TrbD component